MQRLLILLMMTVISLNAISQRHKKSKDEQPGMGTFLLENQFKDYIPVSPLEYEQYISLYDTAQKQFIWASLPQIAVNKKAIVKFLPNEAVYVTVRKIDMNGEIKYGPASISAEKGSYTVILDYCKFTTLKAFENDSTCAGFTKVGVGLRITANIETLEAGLNVGSLFGLGIAAQAGKLNGTMSIDVIGMESSQITDLIPLPSEISPTSIQSALQAMAAIKSKIYEDGTRLYPQIVAVKKSEGNCSVFDILNNIKKTADITLAQQQQQQRQQQQQQQQQQLKQ